MRISSMVAVLLALGALAPRTELSCQRPVTLGVAGGIGMPAGDLASEVNPGWRALGTLALGVPLIPLGLRVDAAYDQLGFERALVGSSGSAGAQRIVSVSANPTYRLPSAGSSFAPYLIAGVGAYNVGCTGGVGCDSATRFGWNAGLGTRFAAVGVTAFAEARFHRVELRGGGLQYIPATFGLLF